MVDRTQRITEVPNTYRDTTVGQALDSVLENLLNAGEINKASKDMILKTFDYSVLETFKEM